MKTILAILFITLACNAQKSAKWPPTTEWYSVHHTGQSYTWTYKPEPSRIVNIPYPENYVLKSRENTAWINQIMTRSVQGNIVGKTVSVTFTVSTPGGWWPFTNYKRPEDYGTAPARVKLFLIGYDAIYANVFWQTPNLPDLTQWSVTGLVLPELAGSYTHTLSAVIQDTDWSNVNGQRHGATICGADVKQIGLSLSGGKFYSVGIGAPSASATTITINSFSVQ
jgi:hypothetical protein